MKARILMTGAVAGLALILGGSVALGQEERRGGDGGNRGGGDSAALAAASNIIAVPDTRSNSVIVVASSDTMKLVQDLIQQMEELTSETMEYRVFPLQYAQSDDLANAIGELFEPQTQTSSRRATTRVRAESDDQTNSVVVAAPIEDMKTIERLVLEIDTMSEDPTELRVFPLKFANAEEMATTIEDLFSETSRSRNSDQPRRFGGGPFGFFGGDRGGRGSRGGNTSERRVQEETVTAVADTRTNSVVVRAASAIMLEIGKMIESIDLSSAKSQRVFVYKPKNANVEDIGVLLESMFGGQNGGRSSNLQNRMNQQSRTQTGSSLRNSSNRGGSTRGSSTRGGGGSSDGGFGSLR